MLLTVLHFPEKDPGCVDSFCCEGEGAQFQTKLAMAMHRDLCVAVTVSQDKSKQAKGKKIDKFPHPQQLE